MADQPGTEFFKNDQTVTVTGKVLDAQLFDDGSYQLTLGDVFPPQAELKRAIIEYLDNRPDDEQGTTKEWAKFEPIQRKLENLLGVEEGRWG